MAKGGKNKKSVSGPKNPGPRRSLDTMPTPIGTAPGFEGKERRVPRKEEDPAIPPEPYMTPYDTIF